MRKRNALKLTVWTVLTAMLGVCIAQAAPVPPPPPGMTEVFPHSPPGYAPLSDPNPRPSPYYYYKPPGLPGAAGIPEGVGMRELFPEGPPEWLPPRNWSITRNDWSKDPHDLYRTLVLRAKRYTFPQDAVDGFYGTVATSTGPVVLNLISFTGAPLGQQCNTRLGPVRIPTDPLYGSRPSTGSVVFRRGHWVGQVSIQVGSFPEPLPPVTVADLLLVEAVALEMDARIVSWELWGQANTATALVMLRGVEIKGNEAKPTEELTKRQVWLPTSPPETEPIVTPVDFLVQKLGGEWKWDEETKTGEAILADRTIRLEAGSTEVVMNDETLHFDHAPQLALPELTIPLDMARTLSKGLIEIQHPQPDPATAANDNQ